jgi:hypothetical protein
VKIFEVWGENEGSENLVDDVDDDPEMIKGICFCFCFCFVLLCFCLGYGWSSNYSLPR